MDKLLRHTPDFFISPYEKAKSCVGYCVDCGVYHSLGNDLARQACLELMQILDEKRRIDYIIPDSKAAPRLSTDYLFGDARGQMFGMLACKDVHGDIFLLKAFSGQYNGLWEAPGWVPPLLDVETLAGISHDVEKKIKELGRHIAALDDGSPQKAEFVRQRKTLSQQLMKDIHALYSLTNFRGQTRSLYDVFAGDNGIPTGTGDCCAPKLLNYAARHGLTPLGLAEFYWGRENRSGNRRHALFYPSCEEKCRPILGFMLCGLEEARA